MVKAAWADRHVTIPISAAFKVLEPVANWVWVSTIDFWTLLIPVVSVVDNDEMRLGMMAFH